MGRGVERNVYLIEILPLLVGEKLSLEEIIKPDQTQGPKFYLDIEGTLKPWDEETITTEQVIKLGGWDPSQGAIVVDSDNNERTLQPGEVITIKPGLGFGKKVRFKRGEL